MAVTWTEDQKEVIELRDRNILVAAAAGSGKTAVLVERILSRITDPQDPVDVDELLVVTFTKAAAAQMRERIGQALREKLAGTPEDVHLQRQAALLHYAQITTIDSFCLTVLREHFEELDLDPDFRIGDEGELKLVRGDLIEDLLEDCYGEEENEDFLELVETMAVGKTDGGISDLIEQLYFFVSAYPFPETLLEQWASEETDDPEGTEWMAFLLEQLHREAEELISQYKEAAFVCRENFGLDKYEEMFLDDARQAGSIKNAQTYEELASALEGIRFCRKPVIRDKEGIVDTDLKEELSAFRDQRKKVVQKWQKSFLFPDQEEREEQMRESMRPVQTLCALTARFMERFSAYKREKHLVDFNDLEHLALKILVSEEDGEPVPTAVARQMQKTYKEVMIDEYQDSNLVQELLLSSVSGQRIGRPDRFMVGDVKQSIYKFRMARPEIFMEKYASFTDGDGVNRKIDLHQNFRSRPEVLSSVNFCFRQLMSAPVGGIDYDDRSALYPGASYPEAPEGAGEDYQTELLLVETEDEEGAVKDLDRKEAEAKAVAVRIRELTDPDTGLKLWDSAAGEFRPCRYGDIVILLRSFTGWADTFVNVLLNAGIPAYAQSATGYFTAQEVQTVLNFLRVLDNPEQDIPFAALLHSPIGNFSSEEMARMKAAFRKEKNPGRMRGMYGACRYAAASEKEADADLAAKCRAFLELLDSFRRRSRVLPLHELLERIYDDTGYYALVRVMPDGAVRRANLDMLMEKALAYEQTSCYGLFDFVRYIENLHKYDVDFGEAAPDGEGGDTVRITTIHKSKGLEFPVVFVAGMGKPFNRQDSRGRILMHPDLGLAADFMDPARRIRATTLKKQVLARKLTIDSCGEELRILYVAMTRAKEKLILTGTSRSLFKKLNAPPAFNGGMETPLPSSQVADAGSYLDWLTACLSREGHMVLPKEQDDLPIRRRLIPLTSLFEEEVARQTGREDARWELEHWDTEKVYDAQAREEITSRLSYLYPHAADETLPVKVSVSELKYAAMEEEAQVLSLVALPEEKIERPRFLEGAVSLGGAARGTVYHTVLERIDFPKLVSWGETRDEEALRACLDAWKEEGLLTEEEAAAVNVRQILRFAATDSARRMAAACGRGELWREKPFVMGLPASEVYPGCESRELVLIQGIIDAYWQEEGALHLLDYKTDAVPRETGEEILIGRYESQLRYYERALSAATGQEVKTTVLYSFALGREIVLKR